MKKNQSCRILKKTEKYTAEGWLYQRVAIFVKRLDEPADAAAVRKRKIPTVPRNLIEMLF